MDLTSRHPETILISGIHRSGTTLVCKLLSSLPDVVALNEPLDVSRLEGMTPQDILNFIDDFVAQNRRSLLEEGFAISRQVMGEIPDNMFTTNLTPEGLRQTDAAHGTIRVNKPLSPHFTLALKHNAAFAACLRPLTAGFRCYATIRNPLAALASWQTINVAAQQGHLPMAENLQAQLKHDLAALKDVLDRQVHAINWFFEQYDAALPADRIIRYEELVSSHGRCLGTIVPAGATLDAPLESRNLNPLYRQDYINEIGKRLLTRDGVYWKYYSKADVRALMSGG